MASLLRVSALFSVWVLVMFFALKPEPEVPRAAVPEQVRIYLNSHDALRNQLGFRLVRRRRALLAEATGLLQSPASYRGLPDRATHSSA